MSHVCPCEEELQRAFDAPDSEVIAELESCPRCLARLAELAALGDAVRALSTPALNASQRRSIRASLVTPPEATRPKRPWVVAALAAVVLVGLAWRYTAPAPAVEPAAPRVASQIHVHPGAQMLRMGPATDEIIRLTDGKISIEVPHLDGGRFRVITGDAEVEVRGTALDVEAVADRLEGVRVMRGVVSVRFESAPAIDLHSGERWTRSEYVDAATVRAPDPRAAVTVGPKTPAAPVTADNPAPATGRREPKANRPRPRPEPTPTVIPKPLKTAPAPLPPPAIDAAESAWQAAWTHLRGNNHEAASRGFEAFLRAHPSHPMAADAAWWAAQAQLKLGRPARVALKRVINRSPNTQRAGEAAYRLGLDALQHDNLGDASRWLALATRSGNETVRRRAYEALERTRPR